MLFEFLHCDDTVTKKFGKICWKYEFFFAKLSRPKKWGNNDLKKKHSEIPCYTLDENNLHPTWDAGRH